MSESSLPKLYEESKKLPSQKPNGRTRYSQVFVMTMSMMIAGTISHSAHIAIVAMTDTKVRSSNFRYHNWTSFETSLIIGSFLWGFTLMQIPSGYIAHKWSAQKLFSLCLFFSSTITCAIPFLVQRGDWTAFCICRAFVGLCHASFTSCTHILLSKWAPPTERARMSNFVSTGNVLGSVLAMLLSGLIAASSWGWPGIFYAFGFFGLIASILFFITVFDSPSLHPKISFPEREFILNSFRQIENHSEIGKRNPPWKQIVKSGPVWAIIIAGCGSNWGSWAIHSFLPIYMKNILNYDIAKNGLVSTLPRITNWIMGIAFSWISDYSMQKNVSISKIRRISNTVGMWGQALALISLSFVTENKTWPVVLLILEVGLKAGTVNGYVVNQIDLSPNFAGTIYSISNCLGSLVSILATIACGGIVKDVTNVHQWRILFCSTAFIYFCTNLIFIIFGRGKIQPWNNPDEIKMKSIYVPKETVIDL